MLCDLPPDTSEDLLNMYLERLCGSDPHSIEANHDKSMVMASFPCKVGEIDVFTWFLVAINMIYFCACVDVQSEEICWQFAL